MLSFPVGIDENDVVFFSTSRVGPVKAGFNRYPLPSKIEPVSIVFSQD